MRDHNSPRFKSSEVALAAGTSPITFRSYFARGHFRVMGDDTKLADANGLPHLFSLRDALGFALAIRLVKLGQHPEKAWAIAMTKFAHSGGQDREPGKLFDVRQRGETMFLYWPDLDDAALIAGDEVLSLSALRTGEAGREAVIVIALNPLVHQVCAALKAPVQEMA